MYFSRISELFWRLHLFVFFPAITGGPAIFVVSWAIVKAFAVESKSIDVESVSIKYISIEPSNNQYRRNIYRHRIQFIDWCACVTRSFCIILVNDGWILAMRSGVDVNVDSRRWDHTYMTMTYIWFIWFRLLVREKRVYLFCGCILLRLIFIMSFANVTIPRNKSYNYKCWHALLILTSERRAHIWYPILFHFQHTFVANDNTSHSMVSTCIVPTL